MILFDTEQYIDSLLSVLQEGQEVPLLIVGHSMEPFLIHERDMVLLSPTHSGIKKGDIVLFRRKDGQYILHRIYKIKGDDVYSVGDNQNLCDIEGPMKKEQICAVACRAKRHGVEICEKNLIWRFFQREWLWTIRWRPLMKKILTVLSSCSHETFRRK